MKRLLYYLTVTFLIPVAGIIITIINNKVDKSYNKNICTRYCHDKVCKHDPVLPDNISSDTGFYGDVINSLFDIGNVFSNYLDITLFQGYTIANLLVFCVMVPIVHFSLAFLTLKRRK